MSDFSAIKKLVAAKQEPVRLGRVIKADEGRLTVQLDTGARKVVTGTAPVGARVLVKGNQLHGQVNVGGEKVVRV